MILVQITKKNVAAGNIRFNLLNKNFSLKIYLLLKD